MFKTIVFSAFGAGLAVCLAVSALQFVTTEPLILHAEEFEGTAAPEAAATPVPDVASVHQHEDGTAHVHDEEEWGPADGFERTAYTVLANLVVGFAISLMLLGAMALKGDPIDGRRGLLWGVAGFAAVSLLPALGLPPELPGTPAGDIYDRQLWWLGAAAASAAGIALLAFSRNWGFLAAGAALLVAPHVIGAPTPPSHEVSYPGGLAGEFVVASMVVSAVLWSLSGLAAGWLHQRLSRPA
jgi:cobalt transporter subunit CbtA